MMTRLWILAVSAFLALTLVAQPALAGKRKRACKHDLVPLITQEQLNEIATHQALQDLYPKARKAAEKAYSGKETSQRERLKYRWQQALDPSVELADRIEAMQDLARDVAYEDLSESYTEFRYWLDDLIRPMQMIDDPSERLFALRGALELASKKLRVSELPPHEFTYLARELIGMCGTDPRADMLEMTLRLYEAIVNESRHFKLYVIDVEDLMNTISDNSTMRWVRDETVPSPGYIPRGFDLGIGVNLPPEVMRAFHQAVDRIDARFKRLHLPEGHWKHEEHVNEEQVEPGPAVAVRVEVPVESEESIVDEELAEEQVESVLRRHNSAE